MNSVLLWIGGLLAAVLGLLFAVPYAVDWNSYRGVFEEEASRVLGREVRVGGEVNLRLLPMPYVRFEKVRIADADGTLGEPFFRADAFTLWLAVPPLLRGAIEANDVELDRPVLRLVFNERGEGSWQTFKISPGALPFVPSDVAFQSIRIRKGTVSLKVAGAGEAASLTDLDGELSATALEGPYKFRGDASWNGEAREIRVATAAREPDGKLRFKLTVRVPGNGSSYALDGTLADLGGTARLEGALTARLPLGSASRPVGVQGRDEAAAFDLRSAVTGDAHGAKLTDVALSFEQDGKPQLVTGEARAAWRGGLELVAQLQSRWLDLDLIAGQPSDVGPLQKAREIAGRLAELVPAEGSTRATLDVEQVNLGGDAVSDVRVAVERAAGVLKVQEFKAALPGNARLELRGAISGKNARGFEGDLALRGANLSRFLAWAAPGASSDPSKGEGAFWLVSRLSLTPSRVEIADASAELAGSQIRGDLGYRWDGSKELALSLEGASIDISALTPGLLDAAELRGLVWPALGSGRGDANRPAGAFDPATGSLKLRVRAGEVIDGTYRLNDVDADISLNGGALRIQVLKFASPEGLRVELQGEVKDVSAKPVGALRGFVSAPRAEAVDALARLIGSPDGKPGGLSLPKVSAFDLAFTAAFGGRGARLATLRTDGVLEGARVSATIALEGGLAGWREAPIDATVRLEASDVGRLLADSEAAPATRPPPAAATLLLKATGASAASLVTLARLEIGANSATFNGRFGLEPDGAIDLAGELSLAVADLGEVQPLAGSRRRPRVSGIGVNGMLDVAAKGKSLRLEPREFAIGGSRVSGLLTLTAGDRSLRLDGRLRAGEASIPRLIGLLLDGGAEAGPEAAREGTSPWPDAPFAFANLDAIEGQLTLSVASLQLADRIGLSDAEVAVELAPGRVAVTKLDGRALGGRFASTMTLERAPAGASLSFGGRLAGVRLEELAARRGSEPGATGEATVSLEFSGRALSPRGLIAVITGKGEAQISDGRVSGIAAGAVEKAAEAVLASPPDGGRAALERALRSALQGGTLTLGSRKVPLEVADGAVKVGALTIEAPEGRARNETTIDLLSLKVDSEWQIAPKRAAAAGPAAAGKAALPGITLVYVGPLSGLATLEPRLSFDTLERELMVRRMERDVDQLERLRRQDQERTRLETERVRTQGGTRGPGADAPVLDAPLPIPPKAAPGPVAPGAPQSPGQRRQSGSADGRGGALGIAGQGP